MRALAALALLAATGLCRAEPLKPTRLDAGGERHYAGATQRDGMARILGDGELHFQSDRPVVLKLAEVRIANHEAVAARLGMTELVKMIDMSRYCAVEVRATLRLDDVIVGPESAWMSARASVVKQGSTAQLRGCEKESGAG